MLNFKKPAIASIALLWSAVTAAYEPPIGIPDPGNTWGNLHPIDTVAPARPSNWTSETSGYYYVDPSNNNATDSDNTFGYPGKPRATFPRDINAGSYIEVNGTIQSNVSVTYSCTQANPCWVKGRDSNTMPTVPGSIRLYDSSYVFIENINFDGGTGGAISLVGDSHHIAIRDSRITNRAQPNGASSGISILPDTGDVIENIVIYDNHFERLGDWTVTEDIDFHGVTPSLWGRDSSTELRNLWILNNYCIYLSGDCVQVNAGNWPESYKYLHHVYIGHNESGQNRQTGFWIKQASDVIISQNKAYGSVGNGGANAGGSAGFQYDKHNLWIIFNEFYDTIFGIRQSDTGTSVTGNDVYIIGNLMYNIHPAPQNTSYDPTNPWHEGAAIALWHGALDRFIVDNTIYQTYDGINAIFNGGITMHGNIISQKDDHPRSHFFQFDHPARNNNVTINNNYFNDDNTESYFAWWNNGSTLDSMSRVQTNSGQCDNCLVSIGSDGSDDFINPTINSQTRNFNLKPGSPAANSSTKHSAYDTFEQLYGLNIYVDFNGNSRHPTKPSMGAFEFSTVVPPEKMTRPTIQVLN